MEKKLYRSRTDKTVAGVCGGLGSYFNVDPNLVRVGFALLTAFSGVFPGVIGYIVLLAIVPEEPLEPPPWQDYPPQNPPN